MRRASLGSSFWISIWCRPWDATMSGDLFWACQFFCLASNYLLWVFWFRFWFPGTFLFRLGGTFYFGFGFLAEFLSCALLAPASPAPTTPPMLSSKLFIYFWLFWLMTSFLSFTVLLSSFFLVSWVPVVYLLLGPLLASETYPPPPDGCWFLVF